MGASRASGVLARRDASLSVKGLPLRVNSFMRDVMTNTAALKLVPEYSPDHGPDRCPTAVRPLSRPPQSSTPSVCPDSEARSVGSN